ncbi:1,4-dihydroxy-2-naphthoate octaprenyltransferase [Maribacter polysaccharolyticus]|uniref:1,4-dihydroxy-2-naphthoate octaprenyltransferase n=1 Tax=Maribacter polysaccharolyticus TaxID=3020831 RepID=UPI00237FA189|nr:1,4-dihydroxy-2-naphthoate octaprenyltransferase [Maribacter polysaccharolyticus]MDE3743393.1 1,4-dihydroxy-2-naphthoate octaprenyltransferase [Maribacter polysaccharolyticus]
MSKFSTWVNAARLRTLPLSISGILVGAALANFQGAGNTTIFILALCTAIGFQITSNFANDYGDGVKGTDNEDRIGPKRVLQSGLLTRKVLKRGIIVSIIINVILVVAVVYLAFGPGNLGYVFLFMALGAFSIWAAIKYTVGASAYGYRGLGDLFVFIFFGLLAVLGTLFLFTKNIPWTSVLPAISIGALSTGVLNLNNLRDHESDRVSNKNTLVVKMGYKNGLMYHTALIVIGLLSMLAFVVLEFKCYSQLLPLLAGIPILIQLKRVCGIRIPSELDPELKKLAISIFLLALLFYLGNDIFCKFE